MEASSIGRSVNHQGDRAMDLLFTWPRFANRILPVLSLLLLAVPGSLKADDALPAKGAGAEKRGLLSLWDPATSPFIPIPEVGTDPNSGTTIGFLPVFLHSEHDQISRIIAPDVTYNPDLGYGGNFRIFSYPSTDEQWSLVGGAKQKVEHGVD